MKLLLDTNVLIDYYSRRQPHFDSWKLVLVMQQFGDVELWASAKSFTDVFYVCSKVVDSSPLQQAIEQSLSFLQVCSIDGTDVTHALDAKWPDLEDCLIHQAALKIKADYIITRDTSGFAASSVKTLAFPQLIDLFEREYNLMYDQVSL